MFIVLDEMRQFRMGTSALRPSGYAYATPKAAVQINQPFLSVYSSLIIYRQERQESRAALILSCEIPIGEPYSFGIAKAVHRHKKASHGCEANLYIVNGCPF